MKRDDMGNPICQVDEKLCFLPKARVLEKQSALSWKIIIITAINSLILTAYFFIFFHKPSEKMNERLKKVSAYCK